LIKKLTIEEIELLKTQIYSLKSKVIELISKKETIDQEALQTEYKFLYKNSKDLFTMILKDFGSERHVNESIHKKFDKLIDMLIKSLIDFNLHNISHYQASKSYEKDFRNELWPENLKNKFQDD
jgi:hypothetical protein